MYGIGAFQGDLLQVEKQLIVSSEEVYVLADSSKFEKKALYKIADTRKDYRYITDDLLPEELRRLYKDNNLDVFIGGSRK